MTLQFNLGPAYANPAQLASFSAKGPNVDLAIKPDLVAVGVNMYTAAEKLDPNGGVYSSTGYAVEQGTSFSTPLVAGAAALVKAARPGLTSAQYRSLLVNSADPAFLVPGTPATVQQAGGGNSGRAGRDQRYGRGGAGLAQLWSGLGDHQFHRHPECLECEHRAGYFPGAGRALEGGGGAHRFLRNLRSYGRRGHQDSGAIFGRGLAPGQYEGYIAIQGTHSGIANGCPIGTECSPRLPATSRSCSIAPPARRRAPW